MSEEVKKQESEETPQAETEAAETGPVSEDQATEQDDQTEEAAPEDTAPAAEPSDGDAPRDEAPEDETLESSEPPEQPTLPGTLPEPDQRLALLEAVVYVAEEPLASQQIAEALGWPDETVQADLARLIELSAQPARGVEVRKVAGGYKTFTKAEHHEAVRNFVKSLRPKLKLSLPALETLSVIAYKQPITAPEIQAIRGVQGTGVLHTLLKHKLVATAGRKKIVGKPMLYKTTREFLLQFGLDNLSELPSLKELEELSRAALGEEETDGQETLFDEKPDSDQGPSDQGPSDQEESGETNAEERAEQEPDAGDDGSEPVASESQAETPDATPATPDDGDGNEPAQEKTD